MTSDNIFGTQKASITVIKRVLTLKKDHNSIEDFVSTKLFSGMS